MNSEAHMLRKCRVRLEDHRDTAQAVETIRQHADTDCVEVELHFVLRGDDDHEATMLMEDLTRCGVTTVDGLEY